MKKQFFKTKFLQRALLASLPVILLPVMTWFRFSHFENYQVFVQEDGLFELFQFAFYLLASISFAVTASLQLKHKNRVFAAISVIAALGLFFVAGEEISWFQRQVQLQTPAYFQQHNVQSELTLHNLNTVQPLLHWGYLTLGIFNIGDVISYNTNFNLVHQPKFKNLPIEDRP